MLSAPLSSESATRHASILIVGAGGHGRVVAELARACGYFRVEFAVDRSPKAIRGLAAYRGSQAGCDCAEAFQTAFSRL
jgi:D-arabinose 1-dehydrogenase-like Zn-dependent alcohol dehydrogenase